MVNSRSKGQRYERKIATEYTSRGWPAQRGIQTRAGGSEAADVETDLPYHLECKHYKGLGLTGRAWNQAVGDCDNDKRPVVHLHGNNGPHLVVVSLEHWFELMEMRHGEKEEGSSCGGCGDCDGVRRGAAGVDEAGS